MSDQDNTVTTAETLDPVEAAKQELVDFVLDKTENPVNHWAVAATLESRGMRDIDAVEKYGKANIFDLAQEIYARCRRRLRLEELTTYVFEETEPPLTPEDVRAVLEKHGLTDREAVAEFEQPHLAALVDEVYTHCHNRLADAETEVLWEEPTWLDRLRLFMKAALATTPLAIFVTVMLVLVFAWWVYFTVSREQAAALTIGVVLSFLVTGAFVPAMERIGYFFLAQGGHSLPRETCRRLMGRGMVAVVVVGLILALAWFIAGLVAAFFPQIGPLPLRTFLPALLYYLLFSMVSLLLGALYTLRRGLAIITVTAALVATLLLISLTPLLYPVHWVALLMTGLLAWWWWRREPGWSKDDVEEELHWAKLPNPSFAVYALAHYGVLALVYVLYLLIAWLNGWYFGQNPWPMTAWFRTPPEPGLVLLPLIVAALLALVSVVVTVLMLEKAIFEDKPILAIEAPERLGRFFKFYLRGTVFAVPMAVQIFSVIIFGFGLWASLDFTEEAATTVAVGTILCFVVSGGFVQAVGRLGQYYHEQEMHFLVRDICYRIIRAGLTTVFAVGIAWYVINLFIPFFPQRVILISLAYYLLLATLWLFLSVLYTLQHRVAIVMIVIIGLVVIGLVLYLFTGWGGINPLNTWLERFINFVITDAPGWFANAVLWFLGGIYALGLRLGYGDLYRETYWEIYAAHWIGLSVANISVFIWGHRKLFGPVYYLERLTSSMASQLRRATLPRRSILIYSVAPYFVYGALYFIFLFTDRVISWSTSTEPLPLLIWFRTPYELGVDWALLSLLLTIAMLEYTIHEFGSVIIPVQEQRKALGVKTAPVGKSQAHANPAPWYARLLGRPKGKPETSLNKVTVQPHPLNAEAEIAVARKLEDHNNFFFRFYMRQLLLLTGIAVISILITYYAVIWLQRFDDVKAVRDFFANPITFWVFYWAVVGYSFLVWGMLNSVFFFFLSRPWHTIRMMGIVLIINILVGFILSRMFAYWLGVVGLTVGSFFFAVLMTWYAVKVFRNLDYYYYSAY
ncbi:MAG: hypothetical protein JW953_17515 [Anaerolineae bacterium]|nr:hypothetical protein [Anaerolineae bacterium]